MDYVKCFRISHVSTAVRHEPAYARRRTSERLVFAHALLRDALCSYGIYHFEWITSQAELRNRTRRAISAEERRRQERHCCVDSTSLRCRFSR